MKKRIQLLAIAVLTACACSTPSKVVYFQDTSTYDKSFSVPSEPIKIQPADKISILVNCKDPQLAYLFNLPYVSRFLGSTNESASSQGVACYTVAPDGTIDFPIVGYIPVAGLTRDEAARRVKDELESRNLVKNPTVTIDFQNLNIFLLGEVSRPGRYTINRDCVTLLDAISEAGDLTIYGRRDNVRVIRYKDGVQNTYRVDLCSAQELAASPVFNLQQNDVIYVEPNDMRARQSTVNGNNVLSAPFWISVASLATTIITTISVISR